MGTSDLLTISGPRSSLDNGGPGDGPLNTIIIPGEAESTWRLKPPPEGAFGERVSEGEAENAIEESEPPLRQCRKTNCRRGEGAPELKIHLY
ncbi:MAG: hypothetical protein R3C02_12175 [Planctomycetaceae bacterium]